MLPTTASHVTRTRRLGHLWICCTCLLILFLVGSRSAHYSPWPSSSSGNAQEPLGNASSQTLDVDLIVASQAKDNTTWLLDEFADWRKLIYVTDDPKAALTVPRNKGREGMVYLTHIIDNYDELAKIIIFSHANRYQWHNDDSLYEGQRVLSRLRLAHIQDQGYANLRCVWTLGCPSEIRPHVEAEAPSPASDPASRNARAGSFYKNAFEELLPGVTVPDVVGAACCAQFAVTAERIRQRPKSDYERYRTWLLQTELNDDLAGRIIEYLWHIIFGQDAVF
ncbi:hypothetical protein M409DRAFT_27491 [Zasmidium cellare ATCC 36951]|uniref:Uncharacterized protein n=1 Tax=Zasmidium cellare ATCC 36951 TaxID=1080233 RepID=A0A6A6C500_ZASCE|nr:uncharacterized protein M409DRAFT_27491 [Zasmidium cellare ATCC 36951]KAF2162111.1 hypothetical protein M409DRAFT_27491 [Zasmidium cellare ATCC 36951]